MFYKLFVYFLQNGYPTLFKMVGVYCAVEGCWGSKERKHHFPNPSNLNLFNTWVELCSNKRLHEVTLGQVFNNNRVCSVHFTKSDFTTNNRLNRRGYPKLQLPGNPTNSSNIINDQQIPPTYDQCITPVVVQPPLLHVDEIHPLLDNNVGQPTKSINFNTDDGHQIDESLQHLPKRRIVWLIVRRSSTGCKRDPHGPVSDLKPFNYEYKTWPHGLFYIRNYLRDKYDGATEVRINKRGRLQLRDPRFRLPTANDLVYLEESPNYAFAIITVGSLGTDGRICNRTSIGLDGCNLLCCGRGYNTMKTTLKERCHCKFKWCCEVECKTCITSIELHTCK
ncbi:hypothetical protein FQA39_LY18663 [Lamprigera yunnana]|nr:hypothetical protein FQA39_LY18663 [Lamprigera yunnana]